MVQFKHVFQYSLMEKLRSKGFFITTFITVVFIAAVVFLPELYNQINSEAEKNVYVINSTFAHRKS